MQVQLRYLLQLLMEAGCLEWASLVAAVLRDGMAVIRIVNAARSAPEAVKVVRRLHEGFLQLETFSAGSGYRVFLASIQPQARSLARFLQAEGAAGEASPGAGSTAGSSAGPGLGETGGVVQQRPESPVAAAKSRASSGERRERSPSPPRQELEGEQEDQGGCVLS